MTPCEYAPALNAYGITQTVYSAAYAAELAEAARKAGVTLSVHVKVDTGMTRLGFAAEDVEGIEKVYREKAFEVTGIFTHFACSDEISEDSQAYTRRQHAGLKWHAAH